MTLKSRLEVVAKKDLSRIHDASLKILKETGVVFNNDEALEIFKSHGTKVEGKTVFLGRGVVERALEYCPSKFKWRARSEAHSIVLGEGYDVTPPGGAINIQDIENGRRPGLLEDYVNLQKLCQASDVITIVGASPVETYDVAPGNRAFCKLYACLKNTDKPIMGIGASKIKTIQMLDMVEMAFGSKDVMSTHYVVGVTINPLSPLTYGTEVLETLVEFAKRKQPILILPCILAGVTGPINLIGTSVLQNAEILAGMVLVQMINPGNPVVYSPASTVGNMRTGGYITGPPEQFLINITNLQLARDMYHLPTRVMCGMTDSKEVDCQAGFETMQNLMMGILSGANIIHESLGVLDSIMTISYEKFIIDEELIQRVFRIADGVNASEQALSVDVIQEVGTGGTYLTHDSTYERFGNLWKPSVSNWDDYDTWKENGSESILVRANKKFKEVLQNCPESMMDGCLEKELKTYVHTILEKN